MKKKTKTALGIGAASAAAVAAGLFIAATPAYAQEECTCTAEEHSADCNCGCAEAAKITQEKQAEFDKVNAENENAKKATEEAAQKSKAAETKKNEANSAVEEAIKKVQEDKKKEEESALNVSAEATTKAGQAETAANEAKEKEEAAKTELDTAKGYKDGTLPVENTDEYKKAQETQAELDKKSEELDTAKTALDNAEADTKKKQSEQDAAQSDYDSKKKTADDKQAAEDNAKQAADSAKEAHDADVTGLSKADEEKKAADADVTAKEAAKEAADKAQTEATQKETSAKEAASVAKTNDDETKAALEKYKKEIEEKSNSLYFYKWLSQNQAVSKEIQEQAALAARIVGNELKASDSSVIGGKYTTEDPTNPITYDELIRATNIGSETDATYIKNVLSSLDYIDIGNERRARETSADSSFPLKVSPVLMAMGEVNANHLVYVYGHALTFNSRENVAGYHSSSIPEDIFNDGRDPYVGWYDDEKEDFENGTPGAKTGHYIALTGKDEYYDITGFGRVVDIDESVSLRYNVYYSQTFSEGEGISTDEYRNLIKTYENEFTEKLNKLQTEYDTAHAAYEKAQTEADKALAEKEAADKAAAEAANALTTAKATQADKQKAYDSAVEKETASKKALDEAQAVLDKASKENEDAQFALTEAGVALEAAKTAKELADTVLNNAQKDLTDKQAAYETALADDQAADEALAALMDVDAKQAAYDAAKAESDKAAADYEAAKKAAEEAEEAYKAAVALREASEKMTADEAMKAAEDDPLYGSFAEQTKALVTAIDEFNTAQGEWTQSLAKLTTLTQSLETAQKELDDAKSKQEAAEKLCEEHTLAKKVTTKIRFVDRDGNPVKGVKVKMFVTKLTETETGEKLRVNDKEIEVGVSDENGTATVVLDSALTINEATGIFEITGIETPEGYSLPDIKYDDKIWEGKSNLVFFTADNIPGALYLEAWAQDQGAIDREVFKTTDRDATDGEVSVQYVLDKADIEDVQKNSVNFKVSFKGENGEDVSDGFHTEIYVNGEYDPAGAFGHPGRVIDTDTEVKISALGWTPGIINNEYFYALKGWASESDVYLKFVKYVPEGTDKEAIKAVVVDASGNALTGDWFELKGADLQDGNIELTFFAEKIYPESYSVIYLDDDDTVLLMQVVYKDDKEPSAPEVSRQGYDFVRWNRSVDAEGNVIYTAVWKKHVSSTPVPTPNPTPAPVKTVVKFSAFAQGGATVTKAAATGDAGYAQVAAYSVLAAAAIAGIGIALKRKKRYE